ncbi:hypothetical protein CRYUN_Cryun28dG0042500 [Craigia yunnanensis]
MPIMSNQTIPLDIVYGVLTQLPVKALLRFKSVSKGWCSLINDPYFIKLHLRQSMETNRNNLNIVFKERAFGKLLSVGFDYVNLDNPRELNHPLKRRPGEGLDNEYDYTQVVGSCNGLLCLIKKYQIYRAIVLWNISTRDYKVLPDQPVEPPPAWSHVDQLTFYGFGYDSMNDDYKLVRIVQEIDYSRNPPVLISEVKIYSLKTNTWRRPGEEIPNYYLDNECWRTAGTFLYRTLHWLGFKERIWGRPSNIIAFDVGTEKYHQIELLDNMQRGTYNMNLGALRGCFCMIATCWDYKVNVWMMKDYGVKESWTMLYSLQGDVFPAAYLYPDKIYYKILLSLLWYDIKGEKFKDVNLLQLENIRLFPYEICMESLVKLGD